jgi:hypothetical protein
MQRVYNGPFEYPNLGSGITRCHLQVYYQNGEPLVAIVTELPHNDGTSVTNAIEAIAMLIRQQFSVAHEDLMVFEHSLECGYVRGLAKEMDLFSRVRFDIRSGQFRRPQWTHMPKSELEQLIGYPLEGII